MGATSETTQNQRYPLNISESAFTEIVKITSTLGNADALALFNYAGNGIKNSKDAIRTLGLTQKRYYSRLKDLVDANLIAKVDGEYRHTALAKYFYDMKDKIETVIDNKERLRLVDRIGQAGSLSSEEAQRIAEILSIDDLIGFQVDRAKIVDMFDTAVKNVIKYIDNAEKSIHFASKYMDIRVNQACINTKERGIEAYFLIGNIDQFKKSLNMLGLRERAILIQSFGSFDMNVRFIELPYTFLIVDGRESMIEVPKPFTDVYTLSIFFENKHFSLKLMENFDLLWDSASEIDGLLAGPK